MRFPAATELPSIETAAQSVLAGENACVYSYGLIGAHLTGSRRAEARADLAQHTSARDVLRHVLVSRQATPAPAAAAYSPPFPVTDSASAVRLAALIEDRLALIWADLVAAAKAGGDESVTRAAVAAVAACAVRSTRWSGHCQAFPGLLTAG